MIDWEEKVTEIEEDGEIIEKVEILNQEEPIFYKRHKTTPIEINGNLVEIDKNMISTIQWFNSLDGIKTQFCCEGFLDDSNRPNVLFLSSNSDSLKFILDSVRLVGLEEISNKVTKEDYLELGYGIPEFVLKGYSQGTAICVVDYFQIDLRYNLIWTNRSSFKLWKKWMKLDG